MAFTPGYDDNCEILAEHFLSESVHTREHVEKLAYTIQQAVEDWMREFEDASCERPTPSGERAK